MARGLHPHAGLPLDLGEVGITEDGQFERDARRSQGATSLGQPDHAETPPPSCRKRVYGPRMSFARIMLYPNACGRTPRLSCRGRLDKR